MEKYFGDIPSIEHLSSLNPNLTIMVKNQDLYFLTLEHMIYKEVFENELVVKSLNKNQIKEFLTNIENLEKELKEDEEDLNQQAIIKYIEWFKMAHKNYLKNNLDKLEEEQNIYVVFKDGLAFSFGSDQIQTVLGFKHFYQNFFNFLEEKEKNINNEDITEENEIKEKKSFKSLKVIKNESQIKKEHKENKRKSTLKVVK